MTAQPRATVVDADGHVLEPADTWQKYLEPQLRDRAIHIARDAEGLENLIIDGRPLKNMRGQQHDERRLRREPPRRSP
jgi:hypothetical protein